MTAHNFPEPGAPSPAIVAYYAHTHRLSRLDIVQTNPNGTWSSLWGCPECPDVFVGDLVGPVPPGYCECGWVQKKWPRKKCEDCKRVLPVGDDPSRGLFEYAVDLMRSSARDD